jgi:hypothetical protein
LIEAASESPKSKYEKLESRISMYNATRAGIVTEKPELQANWKHSYSRRRMTLMTIINLAPRSTMAGQVSPPVSRQNTSYKPLI